MFTFFRNFRNLKSAYLLNIIGLSVAFTAFIIIMIQVRHEYRFDCHTPDSERIYRVEFICKSDLGGMGNAGDVVPIFSRPWADEIITSSPLIEAGSVLFPFLEDTYFTVDHDGDKRGFEEDFNLCAPEVVNTFHFEMIEGTTDCFVNPDNVLIPLSIKEKLFGTESAIGKQLHVKEYLYDNTNVDFTIGGVYQDFKDSQLGNSIYAPLQGKIDAGVWGRFNYYLYIKLRESDNYKSAIDEILTNYKANFKPDMSVIGETELRMTNLRDIYFLDDCRFDDRAQHGKRSTTIILFSIGILILILATINFTNFSMALIPFRIKSVNTKKVLGSTNAQLKHALIEDAVWTTVISAIIAIGLVAVIGSSSLSTIASTPLNIMVNWDIALGTIVLSVLIGILAGIYPANYTTSYSPALVLKGSFGLSPRGLMLRKILVAVQFVISLALISCSLLIQKQNRYLQNGYMGFNSNNLYVADFNPATDSLTRAQMERELLDLPYVKEVAYSQDLICSRDNYQRWAFFSDNKMHAATAMLVSWNFLKTLEIPLVEGEYPNRPTSNQIILLPNNKARNEFGWDMSSQIGASDDPQNSYIFHLQCFIEDARVFSLRKEPDAMCMVIAGDYYSYLYVRTVEGADMTMAINDISNVIKDSDPSYPVNVLPFEETITERFKTERHFEMAIKGFSILAIIISMIGVFGLILFDTQQKRKEIAIRRVHGATEEQILTMFSRPYFILLGICFAVSVPIVIYIGRIWLSNFAYKVEIGVWIFIASLAIIGAITMITILIQVLRSIRNNPIDSIKIE